MNIFSNLANVLTGRSADATDEAPELTPEEQAAEDKKARIKWHRDNVRNGPVSFRSISAGQQRRALVRAQKREIDRNFKREVRSYFDRQRVAATLRPHLQTIGLIPFVDGHTATPHEQLVSTAWIAQRYGTELLDEEGRGTGNVSFADEDVLLAIQTATKFYATATGHEVRVPADFEVVTFVGSAA